MIDKLKRKMRAVLRHDLHASRKPGSARRAPVAKPVDDPRERAHIIDLLQSYRASESLNARYCGMWAEVSPSARMRGGLRLVQAREGTHARLMRERLQELGETELYNVSQVRQSRAIAFFASRGRSDVHKLRALKPMMNHFDAYFRSLVDSIEAIHEDACTRELLRTIIDDERATTLWFARMYRDLSTRQAKP